MATIALGFNISASATGMAQGVNAAAVQLEKLGYAAKKTAADVGVLKTLSIGRAFVDGIRVISGTFTNFASGVLEATESTSNLARELGISYNELTALQLAAQLSGASTEDLAKAFTRAQVTITKAANGGKEAAASLAAIGLSARDFEGLTSSQQFTLLAEAINGISDPAQRAAAAVAIFGKSGASLLPVFRELTQNLGTSSDLLQKFNGGITAEQEQRVLAIGDAFDVVAKAVQLKLIQVLAELQPVITATVDRFIDFIAKLDTAQIGEFVAASIGKIGRVLFTLGDAALLASNVLSPLVDFLSFVVDNATGAALGFTAVAAGLKIYASRAVLAAGATTGLRAALGALVSTTGVGLVITLVGALAGAAIEWGLKTDEAGKRASKAIDSTADSAKRGANSVKALGENTAGSLTNSYKAAEDAAKKAADAAKRAADTARREADAAIQRVTVEQQFGGDSQRYAAAQAVEAIQADILRTQQEIEDARKAGDRDAINAGAARLAQLDQALKREQDIASGARKAAEQRLKLEQDYARAREAFDERRLAALARPNTELLQLEDTRTASGYAALQRFSADQSDDPALQEYRKQLKELQAIRKKIGEVGNQAETVDILGA